MFPVVKRFVLSVTRFVRAFFKTRVDLAIENLALRQQLAAYKSRDIKPVIRTADRHFWVFLRWVWNGWSDVLIFVKPETVIRWHRQGIRHFWRWKSRKKSGRPPITEEHIAFIRRISYQHPDYSGRRIAGMLKELFGVEHAPSTVNRYRVKSSGRPQGNQKWSTFLKNQNSVIWSFDFCTQFTVFFAQVYILVILELGSRKIVHTAITTNPSLDWLKQQIRYATFDGSPKFFVHDNDGIYGQFGKPSAVKLSGKSVSCRSALDLWLANTMGIRGIPTPFHAPNANAFCERTIGTLRRECLDHVIFLNENHVSRVVHEYQAFYNEERYHQGAKRIPTPAGDIAQSRNPKGRATWSPLRFLEAYTTSIAWRPEPVLRPVES